MNCFKPFKITFRKGINNSIVKNNHCELNNNTHASWVVKALDTHLCPKTIKSGLRVIGILLVNHKVMDEKTRPNEVYITTIIHILDEDNDNFYALTNDIDQSGEDGVVT